jgi:hypothetical protein
LLLALFALLLVGCQSARIGKPVTPELAKNDPDAQLEFWHSLTDQPVASNDEAFHGLLLYADGKDDTASYYARVAELKRRKMIPGDFNQPADAAVQRGTVAVAMCRTLNIKGGLTMRVLGPIVGPVPRYAVRELQFMGLMPPGSPQQTFSGNEFVGIIGRMEDYQRGDPANLPAADMPGSAPAPAPEPPPTR